MIINGSVVLTPAGKGTVVHQYQDGSAAVRLLGDATEKQDPVRFFKSVEMVEADCDRWNA
jgi:hypothetical protein